MVLTETCTAEVSSGRVAQRFLALRGGPQGLRRPRFSFFRFTCQTARRSWRPPLPGVPREPTETPSRRPKPAVCHTNGEELRRRAIAPKAGRRAVVGRI